ncbi:MAG: O-antigen ligase family protein, partial [Gammaproteobacteria bacterium]
AGEQVQGEDTGQDRIAIIAVQWRLFGMHPFGCGATCTTVLSKHYLDPKYLADNGSGEKVRASHNTFMSMLVDHGIPGLIFYVGTLLWSIKTSFKLARAYRTQTGFLSTAFPAIAAGIIAMTVGDMFVTYTKFEIRIWWLTMLMTLVNLEAMRVKEERNATGVVPAAPARGKLPAPGKPGVRGPQPRGPRVRPGSLAAPGGSERPSGSR